MSVVKVKLQEDFVVLSLRPLEDETLSFKAKGLWAYCMSRPKDWQFHVSQLAKVSKDGIDGIYSALKELIDAGYCRKAQKNENGRFGKFDYEISYQAEFKKSLPHRDFPHAEVPQPVNPVLPSIDSVPSIEKEPPPTPKTKDPKTKEDWRRFFSNWKEEEFEFVWKELEKAPKGSIKSMNSWFNRVRLRFAQIVESKAASDKIQNSRKYLAKSWEGKKWRGDRVTACKDWVEFTDGSYYKAVRYDVPSEEWIKETGWTE